MKEGKRAPAEFNQTSKPLAKPKSKRYMEETGVFHDRLDKAYKRFLKAIEDKNEGVAGYSNNTLQQMRPGGGEMGYIRGGFEAEDGEDYEIEAKFEQNEWAELWKFYRGDTATFDKLEPDRQSIWREVVGSAAYKKWNRYRGDTHKQLVKVFGKKKHLSVYREMMGNRRR